MTSFPDEDDGSSQQDGRRHDDERPDVVPADVVPAEIGPADDRGSAWRSHPSDADVDAAFLQIVSGIMVDGGQQRHPSNGGATRIDDSTNDTDEQRPHETGAERARRRELRRLERAEEVAAFAAREAEVEAEREADDAHFEPPEPPPLPRPKGRTIGATVMILAGILLLARPSLLAVEVDLTLVTGGRVDPGRRRAPADRDLATPCGPRRGRRGGRLTDDRVRLPPRATPRR